MDEHRRRLLRFAICCELDLETSDQPCFQEMKLLLRPGVKVASAESVKDDMMKTYEKARDMLMKYVGSLLECISLSGQVVKNEWDEMHLIGWIVHFIDDKWNLQLLLLDFNNFDKDDGKNIYESFDWTNEHWKISEKILGVTMPKNDANDVFLRMLLVDPETKLKRGVCVSSFAEAITVSCQSTTKLLRDFIYMLDELVNYIDLNRDNLSFVVDEVLEKGIEEWAYSSMFEQSWTTNVDQLELALKYRSVFEDVAPKVKVESWRKKVNFVSGDWKFAKDICSFLVPFKCFAEFASKEKHIPASAIIPSYYQMMKSCSKFMQHKPEAEVDDERKTALQSAVAEAKAKLLEYRCNIAPTSYICSILDPRCNIRFFDSISLKDIIDTSSARKYIREAYDLNYSMKQKENLNTSAGTMPGMEYVRPKTSLFNPVVQDGMDLDAPKDELDLYMARYPCDESTDPLQWWKSMSATYPTVAKMARDYLAIPGTSSCCEKSFLAYEAKIPHHQGSLDPDFINAAHCLKNWFNNEDNLKMKF